MITKLNISPEDFQKALKRHEDKFEKELQEVDIRAVVLKTKKSVLEQAFRNAQMENYLIDLQDNYNNLRIKNETLQTRVNFLEEDLTKYKKMFVQYIAQTKRKRNPIYRFWDFIKCLMK
jgi:predicted  nucleic acid-binding Zn-ribbon protein